MSKKGDGVSIQLTKLGHTPCLDGMRGIAILAVLIFHLEWHWLPGGFFGVDIFFALSGFLTTTLLLEEQFAFGKISLKRFFLRRAIRLYPALVALVIFSSLFTLVFHRATSLGRVFTIAASILSYNANWLSLANNGGWLGGMTHTWSLAIEGQFYLLCALIIAFAARRYSAAKDRQTLLKTLAIVAITIGVASSLWRAILWSYDAEWMRTYLGTDTRLDGVFIGSAAALLRLHGLHRPSSFWLLRISRFSTALIEICCVSVLVFLLTTLNFHQSHLGLLGFTIASVMTSVLILTSVLRTDSLLSSFFRLSILTWIGRISYSIYIWHMPAKTVLSSDRLIALGFSPLAAEIGRVAVSLLLGAASYYGIEKIFMKLQRKYKPQASDKAVKLVAYPAIP
jgi:peptidoglycan/LPS O-acetylase OafA/YrhL